MFRNKSPIKIFIYTALPCEAKPLIDFYKLKKELSVKSFAIYIFNDICLTVTGVGKTAMSAGIAYSQALYSISSQPIMLNVGIAGHQHHPLGRIFLVDKITDNDTGRNYYPPLNFSPSCPTVPLQTFSVPQSNYPTSALCDMEGSAFYEIAARFSTGELIQCLKVISDNNLSPSYDIQPKQATELISAQMPTIIAILQKLTHLANLLTSLVIPGFDQLLDRYHFTVNEQIQLKKLLARWRIITGLGDLNIEDIPAQNGKEFLSLLNQMLNTMRFEI